MPSHIKKRDIADFFKPFARDPPSTVPRKRSAQYIREEDEDTLVTGAKVSVPRTPAKSVSFKDVTPRSRGGRRPTFSPISEASLPIRSPRSNRVQAPPSTRQRVSIRVSSPLRKTPSPEVKPNTSFTFSDSSERSQKVIKEGVLVAIRDSDEDSDESIESLSEIFKRDKKNNTTTAPGSSQLDDGEVESERVRALSKFTHGRSVPIVGKDRLRALHARERASKFDLSRVLDDHFGAEETEISVRTARQGNSEEDERGRSTEVDKALLERIVKGADQEADDDDVSRLLGAVERTEALAGEKTYSFFDYTSTGDEVDGGTDMDIPETAIPHNLWRAGDRAGCSRAYLSGFMAEEAARGNLDDEALRWTFNQVTKEPRDDLRHAYVQTLQAGKIYWTRLNLTASDVQMTFQSLGGHKDALRDNSMIEPRYQPIRSGAKPDLKHLLSTLELFTALCSEMDMLALSKLSSILMRLTLDTTTISNTHLSLAIENLMSTLLELPNQDSASHVYNRILTDAMNHLHDPKLQALFLSQIQPTSTKASQLRKTLADTFLLGPSTINPKSNTSTANLDNLATHISTSPSFNLTRHKSSLPFNYPHLTALTSLLDISISSGNPPPSSSPSSKTSTLKFNQSLDNLTSTLHHLFTSIKDTGASHLRRTEAKDHLQALYYRLLYSVRIGTRKKKHVFDVEIDRDGREIRRGRGGEEVREERRGGEFMKRFLERKKEKEREQDGDVSQSVES